MGSIAIRDENLQGSVMHELILQFEAEKITVAELISSRVRAEVEKYESRIADVANNIRFNLVQPSDIESRLNNKKPKKINVEKQIDTALKAFDTNGFFILVDDEQVENLQDKIAVTERTTVSFVKLTPLVGG